jgi:glutathione S-transferase
MSTSEIAAFRLERTFAASPEEVFDAWTSPEVLKRWWAARPTWTSPGCEVDLRVGGRYLLRMHDAETGEVHAVGGEYREVVRPHRLVYTWCWEGDGGPHPGHVSLVTVEFRAEGADTTVALEHSGLASEESRTSHGAGWRGSLENLAHRIFKDGGEG